MSKAVAVIDGNSLLHRAFHAVPPSMTTKDGTPTNAVFGFIQMILKMIKDFEPDAIVCAWDVHRPDWRMKLLEAYKAQRPPMDDALKVQFPLIKDLLKSLGIPCVSLEGFEGDDILGTVAARAEEEGMDVYLITGDKDAYQLVTENTRVVTTKKGMSDIVIYTPEKVVERYGVEPQRVTDFLGLKGDTSDNIPGVPGIGEKTAAKLLAQYADLEDVLAHASEIKGKMGQNISEHADDARISKQVATIRKDAPIDIDLEELHFPSYNAQEVVEAFSALGFKKHLSELSEIFDDSRLVAAAVPKVEVKFDIASDAKSLVENACESGRVLGFAFDEPAEDSLFALEPDIVFSDGAACASISLSDGIELLISALEKTTVAVFDAKKVIKTCGLSQFKAEQIANIFDCSIAAYLLDSSTSQYAIEDLASTHLGIYYSEDAEYSAGIFEAACANKLYSILHDALEKDSSLKLFEEVEMPLVPVLAKMEEDGVYVDKQILHELSAKIGKQIDELHDEIIELAGEDFNIDSTVQLGKILFEKLGLDTKKTKKNKRGYSTSAQVLEKLADDHPMPGKVIKYRELAKLRSTYTDALPSLVDVKGRVHTTYHQTVTSTGRLSSSDPNLQNIPVRTELGREIRRAFKAPQECVFLSADYSQIELRLLAHLSQDEHLINAFLSGEDFHRATAARVFGVQPQDVTPQMRARAKAVNFGIVYGQQAFGLGQTLHIPLVQAKEMIDRYFEAYPGVRAYLDELVECAKRDKYVETLFGRKRHIPEIDARNAVHRNFAERTAMNHPMQGSAADIIKIAMVEVQNRLQTGGYKTKMVLQVHDELDFECPLDEVDRVKEMVTDVMSNAAQLRVPLIVDVSFAENWAEAH